MEVQDRQGCQVQELYRYRSLVWAFAYRDLKSRYRTTFFGWVWTLVGPVTTLLIYGLVFSVVFRAQAPELGNGRGSPFVLWLFCGLVIWNCFSNVIQTSMGTLRGAAGMLSKVYLPPFAPVLGTTIGLMQQVLIEAGLLLGILLLLLNVSWTWLLAVPALLGLALFAQGVGFSLSVLNARFGDVQYIVTVVLQALFFLSPVLYPISSVPSNVFGGIPLRELVWINPVTWYLEAFRAAVYTLDPVMALWSIPLLIVGAGVFWLGLWHMQRVSPGLSEVL